MVHIKKTLLQTIKWLVSFLEKISPYYFSVHVKPQMAADMNAAGISFEGFSDTGIAMQGPLIRVNNFTIETIKAYRCQYPNIAIVYSTWTGELKEDEKREIAGLGCVLLENEKPANPGPVNTNLQITSVKNGLKSLHRLNVKFILRTRSDQRIYGSGNFIQTLVDAVESNPIEKKALAAKLIINSRNTFRERLYGVTDMFMFGRTNDMLVYWNIPLDTKQKLVLQFNDNREYIRNQVAEGYLVNNFFKSVGFVPDWTGADSIKFLYTYF